MQLISSWIVKKQSAPVYGIVTLLAKINAWLKVGNKQFLKIISVALYVKTDAAMWCVKKGSED